VSIKIQYRKTTLSAREFLRVQIIWTGHDSSPVTATLLDVLVRKLDIDFADARPLILPADRLASRCDPILQPSSRISLTSTSLMRLDADRTVLRSRLHDRHWHFTLVIHANSSGALQYNIGCRLAAADPIRPHAYSVVQLWYGR